MIYFRSTILKSTACVLYLVPVVRRLACSLLLSPRPAPPPLLGSIRVCGGSWEELGQVVVWALVGTPTTQVLFRPLPLLLHASLQVHRVS